MRRLALLLALLVAAGACTDAAERTRPPETPSRDARGSAYEPKPVEKVTRPAAGWLESGCQLPLDQMRRIRRGYFPGRSPEIVLVPREPNFFGGFIATSHSGPWDYLQDVPLVFYGPGFIRARGEVKLDRPVTLADLAPTLAKLLDTPAPNDVGEPIDEVLVPREQRPTPPKLIVTVVWDGGGLNVLDAWPGAWPYLARLMRTGASVTGVTVGSSPSVTPAVHTTIGTGAMPKQHGIVSIPVRDGDVVVDSYKDKSPKQIAVPTLADLYDQERGNRAKIGVLAYKAWHVGMIGHGAYMPGGDRDIAVLVDTQERLVTNPDFYSLPPYLHDVAGLDEAIETVDLDDGRRDSEWMGHRILDDPRLRRDTPAWTLYQTQLIKSLLSREGFGRDAVTDLFFTNYKQPDEAGHNWNMLRPEMREELRYTDDALETLTTFLDRKVGRKEWVVVLTADHGQGPDPLVSHAWPIRSEGLQRDVDAHFGVEGVFQHSSPAGYWVDRPTTTSNGITEEDIADFLVDYRLEANIPEGEDIPHQYESRLREPIFSAAFPSRHMGKVWRCVKGQTPAGG